ncbi:benzoate/H(+) symporter BenE family transporter [Sulfitobacter aestuariivivens]|uniref:Benzoate/H(+) symporter BenE family transporter n=1 Tax=Sulfitobacter aestuariivivens TaxID=2766981 RepID=A0A927D4C5_9RHOB|nr:benzoate/H(+) symporter BenE family transporter [Sulfitobacter aestuariivivens]MBD3664116.1 benzoate/H(+) symporter BenE family transporter [Sulfitobacter aestuariivivens]
MTGPTKPPHAGFPPAQTVATGLVVAIVGFFSSFPIVLQGVYAMGATDAQAASALMMAAIAMGLTAIGLALWFRAPISVAWSTPGAALLAVLAVPEGGFAVAIGAFVFAGLLCLLAGLWRPIGRFAANIPPALAQAMLAGVLLPICLAPARALPEIPQFVIPIFLAWLLAGWWNRLAAVPGAVAMTAVLVAWWGGVPDVAMTGLITVPVWTTPQFTLASAISIGVPLFIVTMATQNIPGIAILRSNGFAPPAGSMLAGVGAASIISAPFGAHSTCLAAITSAMCAGEESHADPALRFWSAVVAGVGYCLFGLFAGLVTAFAALAPPMVVASLAGLALMAVLANAAQAAFTQAADRDAAVVTLLITASGITLFGIGSPVWGLLAGAVVYLVRRAPH